MLSCRYVTTPAEHEQWLIRCIQLMNRELPTPNAKEQVEPTMGFRAKDGMIIEALLKSAKDESLLVSLSDGKAVEQRSIVLGGQRYVPYSARNNLLTHRVILLPSSAADFRSHEALLKAVQAFIHRYVDVEIGFEEIAAHYVLMTWGYDVFNELPYLRVRGDYGSGKSRFLLTVGSICYKPIFASGASTVSPIFRLIDQIGGTLVVDEADFWASDERAEIVKILNNGNARGFPVLRSDVTPSKEINPKAFNIFGPKLVATRHAFDDEALESRCLTAELVSGRLRKDIPISLPRTFEEEAQLLRDQLLMFRLRRFSDPAEPPLDLVANLPPRRAQILAPLLRVAVNDETRKRIVEFVLRGGAGESDSRREAEKRVLTSLRNLMRDQSAFLSMSAIARQYASDWDDGSGLEVSPRWIGSVLRRLGIQPKKSNGVYVVSAADHPGLQGLISARLGDFGDVGDIVASPATSQSHRQGAAHAPPEHVPEVPEVAEYQ